MVGCKDRGRPRTSSLTHIGLASARCHFRSFAKEVDSGEKVVVGVNRFTDAESEPAEVFPIDVTLQQTQIDRTKSVRAARHQSVVDAALSDIAVTARGEGNLLVPMKAALGEQR